MLAFPSSFLSKKYRKKNINIKTKPIKLSIIKSSIFPGLNLYKIYIMKITEIEIFAILLLISSLAPGSVQIIIPQACLEFQATQCTRCRRSTHLYDGVCYENMLGCMEYKQGEFCVRCQAGNFQLRNNSCQLIVKDAVASLLKMNLDKYAGVDGGNPGDQYGEANFIPSSYDEVKSWPSFIALDNFIRKGEYSHYISRMSNPVFSVHYYQQTSSYSYKLLYFGSGGGLFLCIADISPQQQVSLRTLTPISASNIIYNCIDYDVSGKCIGCKTGSHLQGAKCYANYGGCLRYYQNLCIECVDYYLLVENRCISDCYSVSDARSVLYYEGGRTSNTMEIYYGISITTFYTVQVSLTLPPTISAPSTSSSTTIRVRTYNTSIMNINSTSLTSPTSLTSATSAIRINQYLATKNNSGISNNSASAPQLQASESSSTFTVNNSPGQFLDKSQSTVSVPSGQNSSQTVIRKLSINNNNLQAASLKDDDILNKNQQISNLNPSNSPLKTQLNLAHSSNQHCTAYQDNICTKCIQYYFINQLGICQELSPLCVSVDEKTGSCKRCFSGYVVNNGRCDFKLFQ